MSSLPQRAQLADPVGVVLLLLDDPVERDRARGWLEEADYQVVVAASREEAVGTIGRRLDLDVVVAEGEHSDGAGGVLAAASKAPAGLEVILTGATDVFAVTRAIARGASAYLPHPLTQDELLVQVGRALGVARHAQVVIDKRLALPAVRDVEFEGVVGTTPRMHEIMQVLRKAAPTDVPIVITGETGTGKELVARAVHRSSLRRDGPFVAVHLHATPAGLLESELFGHKKGAYTGALSDRTGKLEAAHDGTLFLDELGDIPLETQTKLLRVLETRAFEPVGSNRTVAANFRIIAATNQSIEQMIAERKFREELWFRINVVRIELPPLRERKADIPLLAERFMHEFARTIPGKRLTGIDPDALAALRRHPWPGNIRELRNVIHNMVVLSDGPQLGVRDLPREVRASAGVGPGAEAAPDAAQPGGAALAGRSMDDIERDAIKETLRLTGGNRKAAADLLQIGERTLYRKIEKYGL